MTHHDGEWTFFFDPALLLLPHVCLLDRKPNAGKGGSFSLLHLKIHYLLSLAKNLFLKQKRKIATKTATPAMHVFV